VSKIAPKCADEFFENWTERLQAFVRYLLSMTSRVGLVTLFAAIPALFAVPSSAATETTHPAEASSAQASSTKRLPGGALLHLAPGTRIELGRPVKLQLGSPGSDETPTQVVKLLSGRVDVDLPLMKQPRSAVLIEAPHKMSAVAKGGHSVAIAAADRTIFAAVDGDMVAAAGNDWKPLLSGAVRTFIGSDPTPQSRTVPGAAEFHLAHPVVLALGEDAPGPKFEVGGVAQAEHYELNIWRVAENGSELVRRMDVHGAGGQLGSLPPGHYQVTARGVDRDGIAGKDSTARTLRVVGTELPPGAHIENGAVLLGQHARVKLVGADGLEISYDTSSHFVRAPASVGLSRGGSTLVRIREPGTTDEVAIGLEPRALHADVEISPKAAQWPQDKINVSVRLFDSRGHALPESVKAKATVLVNVQAVEVNWTRSGNVMSAQIPAATGRGPWVVRVEVVDEFGDPAGRDFLEVAGSENERISRR
jgi:hypothetical protein